MIINDHCLMNCSHDRKFIENVPKHLIKLNSVYRPLSTDDNSAKVNSTDSESIMILIYIKRRLVCDEKNASDCGWLVNKSRSSTSSKLAQEHLVLNLLILVCLRSKWTWFIGRSRSLLLCVASG